MSIADLDYEFPDTVNFSKIVSEFTQKIPFHMCCLFQNAKFTAVPPETTEFRVPFRSLSKALHMRPMW